MEIIGTAPLQQDGSLHLPPELVWRLELNFADEIVFVVRGIGVYIIGHEKNEDRYAYGRCLQGMW